MGAFNGELLFLFKFLKEWSLMKNLKKKIDYCSLTVVSKI